VNIALCLDGDPVLGLTYDPNHNEQFWAQAGLGAYVNERPLRASERPDVASSVVGMDLGYNDATGKATLRLAYEMFPNVQCLRVPGSAALGLAYAAAGRLDLFFHRNVFPWDIAAGIVLVREAGGVITAPDGGPVTITSGGFVAGGADVHADFMRRYGGALIAK
jgi:fructose-1,6-bisphosphatase/inositol monophosphatase family enzyme